ncbi:TetR/AcrR family transcriptional regulator [Pseudomonas helleri]|uniref:TetR family transcriptional regulator n=1 Tax=Pseudomonas helleri TaxID=1608996 RepID=A0A6L5I1V1_9PSED|nr:TetR/AcrR family transcriptional regulator [Pseudomonas helleri]MQU09599.1 TetR family transcriptional regulator [Pseudomonas helleri]
MPVSPAGARKRRYLPAAQRKEEILSAALAAFSSHGYAAATIEHIATFAGMSKAGLYAHYKSKDEIFEDLLIQMLAPPFLGQSWLPAVDGRLRDNIDTFIDQAYAKLANPDIIAMLRLLIAESGRAPHLIRRWREEVLQPHIDAQQRMINECVERGVARPSALTRHFALVVTPALYVALWQILFGEVDGRQELEKVREVHRDLLIELLDPP